MPVKKNSFKKMKKYWEHFINICVWNHVYKRILIFVNGEIPCNTSILKK